MNTHHTRRSRPRLSRPFAVIRHRFVPSLRAAFRRTFAAPLRLHAAAAMLVTFLQRAPLDRIGSVAASLTGGGVPGTVLRSATAVAASLGAMHTLAGATTLVASAPGPVTASVGSPVAIGFTVSNTINIGSWKIDGALPPGLIFSAKEGGNQLDGPGILDATTAGAPDGYGGVSGGNITTTPVLTGSPTRPGSYTFSLQAFEFGNTGGLASGTFNFTVNVTGSAATDAAPTVTDPASQTVAAGASVVFTVTVNGSPTPTVQWQKNGATITGATGTTLSIASAQATDAASYTAVATNSAGTATSKAAVLTVTPSPTGAPTITTQPVSITVANGGTAVFNVAAVGAGSYQWRKDGVAISGATESMLVLSRVSAANAGAYTVVVTSSGGSATSSAATLTVSSAEPGRLANLSVRTASGTGDQLLNVGFAIGGAGTSGAKPLLVRVVGPTLAAFGVGGTIADPTLSISPLGSSTVVASNDNWGGNASVVSTSASVGAFALSDTTSADAAVVASLAGGTYTAVAAGKNNTSGIVLTEIYDATPSGSFGATTPRLVNVSARAQVGTGDGVLITGFAITGSTAKTLLIRAVGPTLAGFGVGGTLADPLLQVFQLGGAKLFENDNWGGSAAVATTAASVGAFALGNASSRDSVLLVTLPPGVYTAQVSGVNNGTGIALVEVYEVP